MSTEEQRKFWRAQKKRLSREKAEREGRIVAKVGRPKGIPQTAETKARISEALRRNGPRGPRRKKIPEEKE